MELNPKNLYPNIYVVCKEYERTFDAIPSDRKEQLVRISQYLTDKFNSGQTPDIIAICTHNSRRSHLAQLWLDVGADFYQLPQINSFSGGTTATALNFRIVKGLLNTGFTIATTDANENNPVYEVRWRTGMTPERMYSKVFDDEINPKQNFAAVMVCSEADEDCPIVTGCDFRIALPYKDPKYADGSDKEEKAYEEAINQIGREMLYVMAQVKPS